MITNYNDAASPANANKWAVEDFGGEGFSPYPTAFGFLNTGGCGQIGNYSNATGGQADQRLHHQPQPAGGHE